MIKDAFTILAGIAAAGDHVFFAGELDEVAKDEPNSTFFLYDVNDGEVVFGKYDESVAWPAMSMATHKPDGAERLVVAMGPAGNFWEVRTRSGEEVVGALKQRVNVRRLAVVEGQFFACGMGRVVLQRVSTGKWNSIGPGATDADAAVVGFEALGGYDEGELYAVGWGGEIWWREKGTWRRVESPTKAILSALTCSADGSVYVVGHDGTLLKGRRDAWSKVETACRANLRDVACLNGEIYAVSDTQLFRLTPAGLVADTSFGADRPTTFLHLQEIADGLVSIGQKDIFIKQDGAWRRGL